MKVTATQAPATVAPAPAAVVDNPTQVLENVGSPQIVAQSTRVEAYAFARSDNKNKLSAAHISKTTLDLGLWI